MDVKSISSEKLDPQKRTLLSIPIEFWWFLDLPRDLVKKFMTEYFDSISSLRCIRVCKYLKNLLLNTEIETLRIRVIKQVAYENQVSAGATAARPECELCGEELSQIENLTEHMAIHDHKLGRGKSIRKVTDFWRRPDSCKLCDVPFAAAGPHMANGCPLRAVTCENGIFASNNPWAELVCSKSRGYWKQIRNHSCVYRCRKCLKSFEPLFNVGNGDSGFWAHLRTCEFKEEIATIWRVVVPK